MKVISFTNQKGGAGKSTLAINLAVAAERAGEKVCIVDLDPQGTIGNWYNIRTSETPLPLAVATRASFQKSYSLGQAVMEFEEEGGAGSEEIAELWAWCNKHLNNGEGIAYAAG